MAASIKNIVQAADIPSIPHVLQQILSLADNPRTTSSDLEGLVTQEPALAAQLLKWVNSAFYALPNKISSISHAMIILGFSTVKSVASGMLLVNAFDDLVGLTKEYVLNVWRHTLVEAGLVKILAHREPTAKKDDLFLAAMIHDIGHLVLAQYFRDRYDVLLKQDLFPSVEEEQKAFEMDHTEVGAELLKEWQFPDSVIELVKSHHVAQAPEELAQDLAYLRAAESLSRAEDFEAYLNTEPDQIDDDTLKALAAIKWEWSDLSAKKDEILSSLEMIDQLLSKQ